MRTHSMLRTLLVSGAFIALLAPAALRAQNFDTSGTAGLKGQYLFRYVNFFTDQGGSLAESCSLTGTMTFDGAGKYTLSNTRLFDSAGSGGNGFCSSLGGGNYGVQSNGIAQLDNPLYPATLFGSFSLPVVIASSTEDGYFDMLVAVQAPANPSDSLLNGSFTVGTLDFLNARSSLARQGYFTMNADGHGGIAPFTVTGSLENVSSAATVQQNVSASTYTFSSTASGSITFPGASTNQTDIVSGSKALFVSADGNWFIAGSPGGSDMFVGFRAPSGSVSNSSLNGTYFTAGMENNQPTQFGFLDAFYGSFSTNGGGALITHQRFNPVLFRGSFDNTFTTQVKLATDGSYYDGNIYTYLTGAGGSAFMQIGSNEQFSLIVGIRAPSVQPSSTVWINPIGITNAANYSPITNAYAPGELVSLYGTFGVATHVAPSLPFATTLDGVQVLVNGQPAPVYLVSGNQISALIPYAVAGAAFATFQVVVNDAKSNEVTVYVDNTAPGIYTVNQNGMGPAAILHANGASVSSSNPAKPKETVIMFMNGLGPVTPQVDDGVGAPSDPVSSSVEARNVAVILDDGTNFQFAQVLFAGLAPGFAGLYQVNFTLPASDLKNGDVRIALETVEAENEMATINISGFTSSFPAARSNVRAGGQRHRFVSAKRSKTARRALPERER